MKTTHNGVYSFIYLPEHPLCTPGSRKLPLHRVVLYEKIGPGKHPCHVCGRELEWLPGGRTKVGALIVDHLDGDSMNNDPENLAPCCHGCNIKRKSEMRPGPLPKQMRKCDTCGNEFLWKGYGAGRFCSRTCSARGSGRKRTWRLENGRVVVAED